MLRGDPGTFSTTKEFLKMFGLSSLKDLPELPKYKLDSNKQIVIDEVIDGIDESKNEKLDIPNNE